MLVSALCWSLLNIVLQNRLLLFNIIILYTAQFRSNICRMVQVEKLFCSSVSLDGSKMCSVQCIFVSFLVKS